MRGRSKFHYLFRVIWSPLFILSSAPPPPPQRTQQSAFHIGFSFSAILHRFLISERRCRAGRGRRHRKQSLDREQYERARQLALASKGRRTPPPPPPPFLREMLGQAGRQAGALFGYIGGQKWGKGFCFTARNVRRALRLHSFPIPSFHWERLLKIEVKLSSFQFTTNFHSFRNPLYSLGMADRRAAPAGQVTCPPSLLPPHFPSQKSRVRSRLSSVRSKGPSSE